MSAIVIAKRGPRVVLAGDSLSSFSREDGQTWQERDYKVRPAGDRWAFALAGYQSSSGPGVQLDAYDVVEGAIKDATTLDGALRAVAGHARDLDRGMAEYAEVSGKQAFLRVFVAGLDDSTGAVAAGHVQADETGRDPFTTRFVWGRIRRDNFIFAFGLTGTVAALMNLTPRPDWLARTDVAAARRVIAMQIAESPDRCGPPVSMLAVDAAGVSWVEDEEQLAC